jgi:hypothetical protein
MVAMMRRAEARIHRELADAGALTAESAIQLSPTRLLERRRLQGLIQGGAVRLTANGLHFLDAEGWDRHRRNRQRRALFALCVVVALIGVAAGVALVLR